MVIILSWQRGEQVDCTLPSFRPTEESRCLYKMRGCCSERGKRNECFFPFPGNKEDKENSDQAWHIAGFLTLTAPNSASL